jgi:hypothetical protein
LYEEHDKFVSIQKSLALEIKKNELLSSEVSTCHESISSLKNSNDELNTKLEKVNETGSCVEHVVICNRCKDINFDEHVATVGKLKFARDAYTVSRHPSIKDRLGFRKETKNLTSQRIPVLNKEKGKTPMASSLKGTMPIFMIGNLLVVLIIIDVMIMLLIMIHMLCLHLVPLLFMVEVGLGEIMLCLMRLGECAMVLLLFTILAILPLYFYVIMQKYLLGSWDPNARETKFAYGFQKLL